jgi:predicted nucleic acid-binding Zn ribbon protein
VTEESEPEHVSVFRRIRRNFGDPSLRSGDARRRRRAAGDETSVPYGLGREPTGLGDVLGTLTSTMGWDSPIARAELLADWAGIVGDEIAEHAQPAGIEEGVLFVQVDSNPWATQLRRMVSLMVTNIQNRYPAAGIEGVKVLNPDTPSWKRGPRAIPGRGPRDTYG